MAGFLVPALVPWQDMEITGRLSSSGAVAGAAARFETAAVSRVLCIFYVFMNSFHKRKISLFNM